MFLFLFLFFQAQAATGGGGTIITQRDIVTFLQQLVGAKVLTDEGETYLQLTHIFGDTNTMTPVVDRELNGKGNRLIVRDCYDKMGNDILKSIGTKDIQRVYATGTPGTGKSTFRNYLAWMILRQFKTVRKAVRIAMHKGGNDSFYLLCLEEDGSFRVEFWKIDQLLQYGMSGFTLGEDFFGLSDVSDGEVGGCDVFNKGSIIFSSPNEKTWQQGGKANCDFFYMPLWEKEELCRFDPKGIFKERFDKYGGVARVIWGSEKDVETHDGRLQKKLADFSELQSDVASKSIDSKSHRFVYLQVEKGTNGNYLFNEGPTLIIPTRYLADLVAEKYVDQLIRSTNNSFDISHASVHGILFERVALLLIGNFAGQCAFHIHRSTKRCQFPVFQKDLLEMPEKLITKYFDADQFENIIEPNSESVLAIPNSNYFPGFDAALSFQDKGDKYLALLQMTTADDHPLSKGGFDMLVRAQNTDVFKKIIIIYVLPNRNKLASFGLQKLKIGAGDTAIFDEIPQVTMSIAIKSEGDARKKAKTDGAAEES